ncbi:MAG TPA: SRPBCC domain-containing protein [Trebonia sp.]
MRRARHGQAVGEQAPGGPRRGEPRHHRVARPGEAALPQRRADQRHRRPVDQPVRPTQGPRARGPQESPGGDPDGQAERRVRDLHESDPFRRLSYTWHSMTPELAERFGWDEEFLAKLSSEPRSTVTFEIEPTGEGVVKLTVVHDGFAPGSTVAEMVSGGWPAVIASLKTLLETGDPLPV